MSENSGQKIWSDYLINGGNDAKNAGIPYCDSACRKKKEEIQKKREEAQRNPWSEQNMKKDMLTAGQNMRAYKNDTYPWFTTKGGYIGSTIGGGIGEVAGTAFGGPAGPYIGSSIGSTIGQSVGEYFDPLQPYPATKAP